MSGPGGASMGSAELRRRLLDAARDAGFDRAGVAPVLPSEHGSFLDAWLAASHHGSMEYLARPDAVARRKDPSLTLPGARSALVVAHDHFQPDPEGVPEDPVRGVIARYARGRDYHRVMTKGLRQVVRALDIMRKILAILATFLNPSLAVDSVADSEEEQAQDVVLILSIAWI